jgi:hypothetical protein
MSFLSVRRVTARVASFAIAASCSLAQTTPSEWLYGVRVMPGIALKLDRRDPTTGAHLASIAFPTNAIAPGIGLTWTGARLLGPNTFGSTDLTIAVHPANASCAVIGPTGLDILSGIASLEFHAPTGVLYFTNSLSLYTLSSTTGAVTHVAPFVGLIASWDAISAFAIDTAGNAIGMGFTGISGANAIYSIDLTTATVAWVGDVQIGSGWSRDIAISGTGEVWASFYDSGVIASGLYKLDPSVGFAPTLIQQMNHPYYGIAFAPATVQSTYCTAKTNSLGCIASISGDGFPSPTAATGYTIRAPNVRNQTAGTLAFTVSGTAATPFGGGTLCIAAPWRRTAVLSSGGTPPSVVNCSGVWQMDFNAWMSAHVALPAGIDVRCQWLGRDGGFLPPDNWTLSNALEFTVRP